MLRHSPQSLSDPFVEAQHAAQVTPALKAHFKSQGVQIIPRCEGAEQVAALLTMRSRDRSQVLVGNWGMPAVAPDEAEQQAPPARPLLPKKSPQSAPSPHPMPTPVPTPTPSCGLPRQPPQVSIKMRAPDSAGFNDFLRSHIIHDKPVLPMTVAVAHMASTVLHCHPGYHMAGVEEAKLYGGVTLSEDVDTIVKMTRLSKDDGKVVVNCQILKGGKQPAYGCTVVLSAKPLTPPQGPAWRPPEDSAKRLTVEQMYDGHTLFHGPLLQGLKEVVSISSDALLARCVDVPLDAKQARTPPPACHQ